MVKNLSDIKFKAIGTVHNRLKDREHRDTKNTISEIVLDTEFTEGLDNIEEFTHLIIIFFIHKSRLPFPLKVKPRFRIDPNQEVGVFASRSPDRPNPIGKTTVRLLKRRKNILKVLGLDAIDGTPVLDIKPFIPGIDAAKDVKTPSWMKKR